MKFIVAIILTGLLAFVAGLYIEWWSIAVSAFLVALLVHQRAGKAFVSGAVAIFLLWFIIAGWVDMKNQGLLSKKVAELLHLGSSSLLLLATALIGGIVGGFAAMSASYLRGR
jgi:hypothetical protein